MVGMLRLGKISRAIWRRANSARSTTAITATITVNGRRIEERTRFIGSFSYGKGCGRLWGRGSAGSSRRRWQLGLILRLPCRFYCHGKISRLAASPIMQKEVARLLAGHVVMNGDDVNARFSQRLQHWLQLGFANNEIAINNGIVVGACKSRPRVYAHFFADFAAARHFGAAPEDKFNHAVFDIRFGRED